MGKVNENIVSGLKTTYCKSAAGDKNRTKVLRVIANEYSNKELKEMLNMKIKMDRLSLALIMKLQRQDYMDRFMVREQKSPKLHTVQEPTL